MNKTVKKAFVFILAALIVFSLAACSFSSSSTTTVTTSTTDSNGNTTTNTTTTEIGTDGVKTETTTTTTDANGNAINDSAEDTFDEEAWNAFADRLYATYSAGAEGKNKDGDLFFYGFNDDDEKAILAIVSENGTRYFGREGVTSIVDDHVELYSEETDDAVSYVFSEQDENGDFTMTFLGDGDVAEMSLEDPEKVIGDLLSWLRQFV